MWEVVLDALKDSAIAVPFLLVIYLLIEWLESNDRARNRTVRLLNGKWAPLVAGGVGLVPQCGFSVMAADLYCRRYLRLGTLIAFFVATSDEALPILLTNVRTLPVVWIVLAVKLGYAIVLGYIINLLDRRTLATECDMSDEHGCCHHELDGKHKHGFWAFVKHPLLHTLKIFVYIFAVNVVFGLLLYYFETPILDFTSRLGAAQSLFTSLIGLIPNCASSVILTGMYAEGIVGLPALLAGLVSNSGIALAILFRERRQWKRNLLILLLMYMLGALCGTVAWLFTLI